MTEESKKSQYEKLTCPYIFLILRTIERAKKDAAKGDREALHWLQTTGIRWAKTIAGEKGGTIINKWIQHLKARPPRASKTRGGRRKNGRNQTNPTSPV